jgi:hypothetical protein
VQAVVLWNPVGQLTSRGILVAAHVVGLSDPVAALAALVAAIHPQGT